MSAFLNGKDIHTNTHTEIVINQCSRYYQTKVFYSLLKWMFDFKITRLLLLLFGDCAIIVAFRTHTYWLLPFDRVIQCNYLISETKETKHLSYKWNWTLLYKQSTAAKLKNTQRTLNHKKYFFLHKYFMCMLWHTHGHTTNPSCK